MSRAVIAIMCLALLALSACANTARGFRQDSAETGRAVDSATHRVLKAGQ
ncbi:entericidin [Sinorhizobium numidicum]|uniref:Entericidin n=1 Tax=Sinorhizobium numidicum TaxID=680248 RepID=A0ABY8CZ94_9HYPH|nr:entericidin [Sinorhizobium numidicum]WEX76098.1 entericidin [Sinorhizobium numidicum]WEX82757.1 entericidin [Sinorhizobium numidicum]